MKGTWTILQVSPTLVVTQDGKMKVAATNPFGLPIKKGAKVEIKFEKRFESLSGIILLVLPIIFCAAAVILSPLVAGVFGFEIKPFWQFVISSVIFFLVFIRIKSIEKKSQTLITAVITNMIE